MFWKLRGGSACACRGIAMMSSTTYGIKMSIKDYDFWTWDPMILRVVIRKIFSYFFVPGKSRNLKVLLSQTLYCANQIQIKNTQTQLFAYSRKFFQNTPEAKIRQRITPKIRRMKQILISLLSN